MAYELEIPREAIRLATEEGYSIERAWWAACENDHHRMEHWAEFPRGQNWWLLFISQRRPQRQADRSAGEKTRRPLPAGPKRTVPLTEGQQEPKVPAPPAQKTKAGKGNGKGKKSKSRGRGTATGQTVTSFQALMDLPRSQQPQFTAAEHSFPGVCYAFQSNTSTNSPCSRAHVCTGCGKANECLSA